MREIIKKNTNYFAGYMYRLATFILLLILYLSAKGLKRLAGWKFFPKVLESKFKPSLSVFYKKSVKSLDLNPEDSIRRIDLIELSIRNLKARKTRTIVTVGGMMIGIGAIVFLVSIGYGLQQLVVTRVARLDEMKQADITPQPGGKIKIDDKTLSDFQNLPSVDMALPLIAVVGRVNYQNSVSDMAAYGVTTDYLKQSAIKPIQGKIFESNDLTIDSIDNKGEVAGISDEAASYGLKIRDVNFSINLPSWVRVRESPSTSAKILGYTRDTGVIMPGEEIWGESYLSENNSGKSGTDKNGKVLGKWIKTSVPLWKQKSCSTLSQIDCEDGEYVIIKNDGNMQLQKEGYFAEVNIKIEDAISTKTQVLGIDSEESDSDSINWVEISSEAGTIVLPETKTVELSQEAKKQAVVNKAMLKILGINENEAVGKKFNVSFVVVGDLLEDRSEKVESSPSEYVIVGVIPDDKTPVIFVPFIDIRSLGIANYSQVKLVVNSQADLSRTRRQIEAMGYVTRSVADTVDQINSLFATARTILMLLGMVALSVAALGMFNTLTVSLLERTREVGLMKAMGMKSSEVQELFLTESMIMGFFGGILGILLGMIAGKILGLALSFFAVFKGAGLIDVSYFPFFFVVIIVFLSLLVGIATGIYPAKRSTKISALNALRYE